MTDLKYTINGMGVNYFNQPWTQGSGSFPIPPANLYGKYIIFGNGSALALDSNGNISFYASDGSMIASLNKIGQVANSLGMMLIDMGNDSGQNDYGLKVITNSNAVNTTAGIAVINNGNSDGIYIRQVNAGIACGLGIDVFGASARGISLETWIAGTQGIYLCHQSGTQWGHGLLVNGEASCVDMYPLTDTFPTNPMLSILNAALSNYMFYVTKSGQIGQYNGIATQGLGVSPIVKYADLVGNSSGGVTVCTFTPTVDGTFEVGGFMKLTAYTSGYSGMQCSYTDEASAFHTIWLAGLIISSSTVATSVSALDSMSFFSHTIRAKAGTAITLIAAISTATGNWRGFIKQIA